MSIEYSSTGAYKHDTNAFMFAINKDGDIQKFGINSSGTNAEYQSNSYGPTFGSGHDLYIANKCDENTSGYMYATSKSYESKSAFMGFDGLKYLTCVDYEVYYFE